MYTALNMGNLPVRVPPSLSPTHSIKEIADYMERFPVTSIPKEARIRHCNCYSIFIIIIIMRINVHRTKYGELDRTRSTILKPYQSNQEGDCGLHGEYSRNINSKRGADPTLQLPGVMYRQTWMKQVPPW